MYKDKEKEKKYMKEYSKKYYLKNKKKKLEQERQRRLENPEKYKKIGREKYLKKRAKVLEWRKTHPLKKRKMTKEHKKKLSIKAKKRLKEKSSNWKGGKVIIDNYRYVYCPTHPYATQNKYVLEHRLVMEAHVGRHLLPIEVVHHINGDKLDNRIENLILYSSPGEHTAKEHANKRGKDGRFKKQKRL